MPGVGGQVTTRIAKLLLSPAFPHCLEPIPVFAFAHFNPAVMQHTFKERRLEERGREADTR